MSERLFVLVNSALWMGIFLFLIGAVFITHVPNPKATSPSGASIAMAVLIYLFVIPYCFSWGVMCWVICAEIFNTRSRACEWRRERSLMGC